MSNINSSGNMTPRQLSKYAASFGGKDAADQAINRYRAARRETAGGGEVLNKSALEKLLQSPEAQQLMKKFRRITRGKLWTTSATYSPLLKRRRHEGSRRRGGPACSAHRTGAGSKHNDRGFSMDSGDDGKEWRR